MSLIQKNQLHIDKHLSNVAINFRTEKFFADEIYPVVSVTKQTDLFKVYSQADLWRIEDTVRAPGDEANQVTSSIGSDSYVAKNYALKAKVTVEDRANADPGFVRDLEKGRVMFVMDKMLLDMNRRVALQATTITNVGTGTAVASSWADDNTNSDPRADILSVIDTIEDATGYRCNRAVFGGDSWRHFKRNSNVIDKTKSTALTGAALDINVSQAADLLELEKVTVARGYFNSADEGQDFVNQRIWPDSVLVYYTPGMPSLELPSFAYAFRWVVPGVPNMQVERLPYNPNKKIDELEIGYYQDEKITSSALGGLILRTNSSN